MSIPKVYSILAAVTSVAALAQSTWVAPLAPRKPALPAAAGNPVDAFLSGVPGKPVSDPLYARRVYLDVWGLLPAPEQLRQFVRDGDPDKRARLVDQLLADKTAYAAHWISLWNDLLRNDEGVIYHGERKSITSWLRKALEENMPYDRFVATLLNPALKGDPEGFIIGVNWRGEIPASERPPLQAAQNSAQTFLGVNLKCNVCHDSFISKWKLKDAYGLASFFTAEPLEIARCDVRTGEMATPKFLFPELGAPRTEGTLDERRAEAARLFTAPQNGRLTRTVVNRYWKQLFGRGLVEPVDDMSAEPWNADLLDWLASDLAGHGFDLKHLLRTMLTSRTYQLPTVNGAPNPRERYVFRGPHKRRLSAEQFAEAVASITGEWRYKPIPAAGLTSYVRDWELKSTPLTRALGRPVRDQVATERLTQPTTLQALELVNGVQLAGWLHQGARRLVDNPPPPPANLFDSGVIRGNSAKVDIPLDGVRKLWLLVVDVDSYDPTRVFPMWKDAAVVVDGNRVPLSELFPGVNLEGLKLASRTVLDFDGKRPERFQAAVQVAAGSKGSDVGPAIRFFVFDQEPDPLRLVRVDPRTPVPQPPAKLTPDALVSRVYIHAVSREPSVQERKAALEILGTPLASDSVEDFLWMILMSPEFQYIR